MPDLSPATKPASATPSRRRLGHLVWLAAAASAVVLGLFAWPHWQRSLDLERLKQAGAVFDDRFRDPAWIKLQGSTLDSDTVASLARINSLEDLVLDESNVSDSDLQTLAQLTRLKRLSLVRTAVTNLGLDHLAQLPRLATLILDSSYRVTDEGLDTLARFASLEELSLLDTTVTLPALITLSGQHPTLQINSPHGVLGDRKLALSGTEITDEGLLRLHNARGLRGLELPARITDRGFRHLHRLTDLRYLVAAGTAVTDQGLAELLAHSPPLCELDFSGCNRLTDSGLAQLAARPDLTRLKVDHTAAGPQLLSALSQSDRLELLSLDGCRNIDDRALEQFLASPPRTHLKFLKLSGTSITSASLETLSRDTLPKLEGLDLRDTRVTADLATRLRQRFDGCRVLHGSSRPIVR